MRNGVTFYISLFINRLELHAVGTEIAAAGKCMAERRICHVFLFVKEIGMFT